MDWYDEQLANIGIAPDSATGPGASDLSNDDILESIGLALGDSSGQDWVQQAFSGITNTAAYAQRQGVNDPPKAESAKTADPKEAQGLIGKISGFVDRNKSLSEMVLKGVAAAAVGSQTKKAADAAARSRLDELKLKNQQEREKDAQVSASVSGLQVPGRSPGILELARRKQQSLNKLYSGG